MLDLNPVSLLIKNVICICLSEFCTHTKNSLAIKERQLNLKGNPTEQGSLLLSLFQCSWVWSVMGDEVLSPRFICDGCQESTKKMTVEDWKGHSWRTGTKGLKDQGDRPEWPGGQAWRTRRKGLRTTMKDVKDQEESLQYSLVLCSHDFSVHKTEKRISLAHRCCNLLSQNWKSYFIHNRTYKHVCDLNYEHNNHVDTSSKENLHLWKAHFLSVHRRLPVQQNPSTESSELSWPLLTSGRRHAVL